MPTSEQIREAITAIAQGLGVAAEYVWEAVIRQVLIEGYILTILGGAVIITAICFFVAAVMTDDVEHQVGFNVGGGIGTAVGLVLVLNGLPMVLNSGYYTLKRIMSVIN